MLMLDTPDLIALHLGAVAAGAIAVAMSSRASAAELAQILAIVRPAAVVVDAEFASVTAGAVAASSAKHQADLARPRTARLEGDSSHPACTGSAPAGRSGILGDDLGHHRRAKGSGAPATAMWESARNITSGCSAVPAWTACSPLHAFTSPTRLATCLPRFGLAQATSCLSAGPPRRAWRRRSSASNRR